MQQQDDPQGKGAHHGAPGVHPPGFPAIPPVMLPPPAPGHFSQERGFPVAADMHGFMHAPSMQGAGPEVAMQGYGQPADGMAFASANGSEMPHSQMQGMQQHMAFNGMVTDPSGMGHMLMHFPAQRMHGQWPGYNTGMAMPGDMHTPEGSMFPPGATMLHQHPGYPPVIANMNAQGPFPPPLGTSAAPGMHVSMVHTSMADKPDSVRASGVDMVEQLMANVSTGSGAPLPVLELSVQEIRVVDSTALFSRLHRMDCRTWHA